jgi:transposase
MKTNVRKLHKQRKYSEDFKNRIIADFESGKFIIKSYKL